MKDRIVTTILRETAEKALVGKAFVFKEMICRLKRIANLNINILLTGETGTGKSRCAEFIHQYSDRRNEPFIIFNCGACPETLFESQLFGHVKGAFTGAHQDRNGLVAEAENGTLVLDEINSLDMISQVKLNHFLETQSYRRVGENKIHQSNVRIISITNKDILDEIKKGNFRKDLYYRLIEYKVDVPSLRSRKEDIPLLLDYFVSQYSHLTKIDKPEFSSEAVHLCTCYPWPGNIRELEFFVKGCLVDTETATMECNKLDAVKSTERQSTIPSFELLEWKIAKKKVIEQFEQNYLKTLLHKYEGIVARCARHAGMHAPDFWRLMRKHKIFPNSYK